MAWNMFEWWPFSSSLAAMNSELEYGRWSALLNKPNFSVHSSKFFISPIRICVHSNHFDLIYEGYDPSQTAVVFVSGRLARLASAPPRRWCCVPHHQRSQPVRRSSHAQQPRWRRGPQRPPLPTPEANAPFVDPNRRISNGFWPGSVEVYIGRFCLVKESARNCMHLGPTDASFR